LDGADVTDGVFTIDLIANISLEDVECGAAPSVGQNRKSGVARASANGAHGRNSKSHWQSNGAGAQASFIAGPENRLLAEAIHSLLHESPSPYNPLFLYGAPGTGKSHIARGLVQHWRSLDRDAVYTTGADFARDFAAALDNESIARWRARQRDTSLLVVEEVHQLTGKPKAIEELLHTVEAIVTQQGQVVLTSTLAPEHIGAMPPRLAARLVGGLVVQIMPPGEAARLALIQRFAEIRGIALPAPASRMLASGALITAPELFGAVTELAVEAGVDGKPVGVERVRGLLADRRGSLRPTVRSIAALSAKYYGLKVAELTSPTRRRAVVQARNMAIYLARELAGKSLEQLGDHFGGRDHTTVLHGYRTIEERVRTDPAVRHALSELRKMLAHG
jgi:chromosomal replication initiator protein